ncbi:MAG TPA: hypothetical protein IAA46_08765 [Candidatus Gemmiger avium]|nr:hypothetical protein [Candidatus Gemmiger avium]
MELYNEMTDLTLTEQIPDEAVTIPESAETNPDTEASAPVPADLLDDDPDDTRPQPR